MIVMLFLNRYAHTEHFPTFYTQFFGFFIHYAVDVYKFMIISFLHIFEIFTTKIYFEIVAQLFSLTDTHILFWSIIHTRMDESSNLHN